MMMVIGMVNIGDDSETRRYFRQQYIDRLHEAGAEYIVEKPEEIWDIILKIESEKTRDN